MRGPGCSDHYDGESAANGRMLGDGRSQDKGREAWGCEKENEKQLLNHAEQLFGTAGGLPRSQAQGFIESSSEVRRAQVPSRTVSILVLQVQ